MFVNGTGEEKAEYAIESSSVGGSDSALEGALLERDEEGRIDVCEERIEDLKDDLPVERAEDLPDLAEAALFLVPVSAFGCCWVRMSTSGVRGLAGGGASGADSMAFGFSAG